LSASPYFASNFLQRFGKVKLKKTLLTLIRNFRIIGFEQFHEKTIDSKIQSFALG